MDKETDQESPWTRKLAAVCAERVTFTGAQDMLFEIKQSSETLFKNNKTQARKKT